MNFNRDASITIKAPKNAAAAKKPGTDRATWVGMFAAAQSELAAGIDGITHIKDGRAWFQIAGNRTPYSMMLTDAELAMFFV